MKSEICVVGTGYVGMASAIGFAELGHKVRGYDIIAERVRSLQQGVTPYREAGIDEPLRRQLASGRLQFFETLEEAAKDADFIIVCVGTPSQENGSADLSYLENAIEALRPLVPETAVIVLRSTVPPGTSEKIADQIRPVQLVYAPEFLREGAALSDFLNPDRIVVGCEIEAVAEHYLSLFKSLAKPAIITGTRNAELIKGCSNAFLALKVSFANQIANLCDNVGANALEVLRGVGADARIGSRFLEPGIGFGGPCFEKDVKSLQHVSAQYGSGGDLFSATLNVNKQQPQRIISLLESELGTLKGRTIGVWGLSFKAGTDDVRDSIAIRIVEELVAKGVDVIAYDPEVLPAAVTGLCRIAPTALDAAQAEALLVLTEWPQFKDVDARSLRDRISTGVIVDGRNILDADAMIEAGLRYRGIGRANSRVFVNEKLMAMSA